MKGHGRPWKCTIPDCDPFATIGFPSQSKRDEHWLKFHIHPTSQIDAALSDFENLDAAEIQPILFTLILDDRIDSVKTLLSTAAGKKLKPEILLAARDRAIKKGSLEMTEVLTPTDEKWVPQKTLILAVKRQDAQFAEWALARAGRDDWIKLMNAMLGIESDEIYALWEEYIITQLELAEPECQVNRRQLDRLFRQTLFSTIEGNIMKEGRVQHTLQRLNAKLGSHLQGAILLRIAKSSCSIPLIETILSFGVDIDFTNDFRHRVTALRSAAKQNTAEGALLMRYLLEHGAEPGDIGQEKGAREIKQWVGSTWEQLVVQTTDVRDKLRE